MTDRGLEHLAELKEEAEEGLAAAGTAPELESWRIKYLGRKGAIPLMLRSVKDMPPSERREAGQRGNELRRALEAAYDQKKSMLTPTGGMPAAPRREKAAPPEEALVPGHLHPLTLTMRRIQSIFSQLGFVIAEGPLVEEARINFDQLNIPLEHPARAETDTFYIGSDKVLRTSTSPVQIRSVNQLKLQPPFKVFSPGRVFRAEKPDATHSHTFHQVEGLAVGPDVAIADFKGVIEHFYSEVFGAKVTTRLRPHYFPFVEPGFEVDITCVFCQEGCKICKGTRWIEMMGAGMVHPSVLRNMGFDPETVQGYAFGGGIDRLTMLLHNIDDLRLLWSGDLRFLRQFD